MYAPVRLKIDEEMRNNKSFERIDIGECFRRILKLIHTKEQTLFHREVTLQANFSLQFMYWSRSYPLRFSNVTRLFERSSPENHF